MVFQPNPDGASWAIAKDLVVGYEAFALHYASQSNLFF
jgi:hypothetical protein